MPPGELSALSAPEPFDATAIAAQIGDELAATAIFSGHRCTWIGRDASELLELKGSLVPTARSLSGELYGGTAGITLFLAHLDACAGADARRERVVRGALAQSLHHVDRGLGGGFFDGLCGIGHVAACVGEIYHDDTYLRAGLDLLARSATTALHGDALDVISGLAGVVLALAHHVDRYPALLAPLAACSDALLGRATARGDTWRWPATTGFGAAKHCLTGFSHGAAGIAAALLVSYAVTGNPEARRGALGTMRYEDTWFLEEECNWPDLRSFDGDRLPTRRRERARLTCARTWCHGAPGILLTRALAAQLDLPAPEDMLTAALATTLAEAQAWIPGADVSPCHGASGLVECLLHGATAVPVLRARRVRITARTLLRRMIAAHAGTPRWTSGVPSGGRNQSLMVGMSGVGYQLLRWAHGARVPSIFMPYLPKHARRPATDAVPRSQAGDEAGRRVAVPA